MSNGYAAKRCFYRRYGHSANFVTPEVISRTLSFDKTLAVELSSGTGIFDRDKLLYGVTVLDARDVFLDLELSKVCHSREEADAYLSELHTKGKAGMVPAG